VLGLADAFRGGLNRLARRWRVIVAPSPTTSLAAWASATAPSAAKNWRARVWQAELIAHHRFQFGLLLGGEDVQHFGAGIRTQLRDFLLQFLLNFFGPLL
jgi:hypothetical protein